jgi:hypothetical protein
MNSTVIPIISSLNSLFVLPVTSYYYYRNSCHRTLIRCYSKFLDFYRVLFDFYQIEYKEVDLIDDQYIEAYIRESFSYKQQLYIWNFNDGTLKSFIKLYIQCQKMREIYNKIKVFRPKYGEKDTLIEYFANILLEEINKCKKVIADPENKSTIFRDIFGGYLNNKSSSLTDLDKCLE